MADYGVPRSKTTGKPLTWERLREAVHYDPETGQFFRLKAYNNKGVGKPAGGLNVHGYWVMSIDGCANYGHRYAWFYMTGQWPPKGAEIDHIDGNPANNRFDNLRLTDHYGNMQNARKKRSNTSGHKGVSRTKSGNWCASITANGRAMSLGTYPTAEQAAAVYREAALRWHGEFARPDTGG